MDDPDPALAPVIPPVMVPMVHVKLLGTLADRLILVLEPVQTVAVFGVVTAGVVLTTTTVDPCALVHPFTVTVTLYVPAAAAVTLAILGFCEVEVNPFGPVQL